MFSKWFSQLNNFESHGIDANTDNYCGKFIVGPFNLSLQIKSGQYKLLYPMFKRRQISDPFLRQKRGRR